MPDELRLILENPLRSFLVRFFDESSRSHETHYIWNDLVEVITRDQLFKGLSTYQIDCTQYQSYCEEYSVDTVPEMLLFQNNRVRKYFSQKFDASEINEENMRSFVYEFPNANPMRRAVKKPIYDEEICCDALLVKAEICS